MATVTYQTRVPDTLHVFCEVMANLMPTIERHLYRDLEAGRNITDLKREYQRHYGINARQFNAVYATLKGKMKSRVECHKRQIKQLQSNIADLEKRLKQWEKQVERHFDLQVRLLHSNRQQHCSVGVVWNNVFLHLFRNGG